MMYTAWGSPAAHGAPNASVTASDTPATGVLCCWGVPAPVILRMREREREGAERVQGEALQALCERGGLGRVSFSRSQGCADDCNKGRRRIVLVPCKVPHLHRPAHCCAIHTSPATEGRTRTTTRSYEATVGNVICVGAKVRPEFVLMYNCPVALRK